MPSSSDRSDRETRRKERPTHKDRGKRALRKSREAAEERLEIIHEDEHVLVVSKPAGLASATPKGTEEPSAFRLVKRWARKERGLDTAWIIHRLDRDVSGLMVFALSETAFHWLKEDFRARRVDRRYLAVLEGELSRDAKGELPAGAVQSFLREDLRGNVYSVKADRTGEVIARPEEDRARFSVTHWRALATGRGHTLVQLSMDSGRKHQIRVHMNELGHPIVGDPLYGGKEKDAARLCLHAEELAFRHPADGRQVAFRELAPALFWKAVGKPPPEPIAVPAEVTPPAREKRPKLQASRLETSWDAVSHWYAELLDGEGSDHVQRVILPGALRLLEPMPGEAILDVACGEGLFCRELEALGVRPTGIDAAKGLIEIARSRSSRDIDYAVVDARDLAAWPGPRFAAATCIMALMNIDPLPPLFEGIAKHLDDGGRFVAVLLHPAFRAPRQSSFGTDSSERPARRYRRIDGYLSNGQFEIVMNPGEAAHGQRKVTTWTFHRPLQTYIYALTKAGFVIDALEEWASQRAAPGGPSQREENRIRREIPMFLALRARLARPS